MGSVRANLPRLGASLALAATLATAGSAAAASGDISTVAGGGASSAEDVLATTALLDDPVDVAALPSGGFLVSESGANRIRAVSALLGGSIATVAGSGGAGYDGDGVAATAAKLNHPQGVASLAGGGFLIADALNHRVRAVSGGGVIATVAGTGTPGYDGDDLFATNVKLNRPVAVSPTADGGFLIGQLGDGRIRKVFPGGIIETLAGTGVGDDPALQGLGDVATTVDGGLLAAEADANRIVRLRNGALGIVAGTGAAGYGGDGEAATAALLSAPDGVVPTLDGGYLIADAANHRVRRVAPGGEIGTVAGTGAAGSSGDGAPASSAKLDQPSGVEASPAGGFLIADPGADRVRYVEGPPPPIVQTVTPAGPARDNRPVLRGASPPGSTAYLFAAAGCAGAPVASASAAQFGSGGITVEVLDDTTTVFSAVSEKDGIDSACSTSTVTYREDSTPPQTRITSGPKRPVRGGPVVFRLAAIPDQQGTGFRCALDSRPLRRCEERVSFARLAAGRHRFRATAVDAAANSDLTPASRSFKVVAGKRCKLRAHGPLFAGFSPPRPAGGGCPP